MFRNVVVSSIKIYKCIGCESKPFFQVALLGLQPVTIDGVWCLSGGKCLCVSGKVVLWSIYFYARLLVPISYLKLWNYMYRPSVRPVVSVPSSPSSSSVRQPSRRPSRRRCPSSVRPLSVRPVASRRRRRRPLSVRRVPSSVPSSSVLCRSVRHVVRLVVRPSWSLS